MVEVLDTIDRWRTTTAAAAAAAATTTAVVAAGPAAAAAADAANAASRVEQMAVERAQKISRARSTPTKGASPSAPHAKAPHAKRVLPFYFYLLGVSGPPSLLLIRCPDTVLSTYSFQKEHLSGNHAFPETEHLCILTVAPVGRAP